jgi:hypothetical protein
MYLNILSAYQKKAYSHETYSDTFSLYKCVSALEIKVMCLNHLNKDRIDYIL